VDPKTLPADKHALRSSQEIACDVAKEFDSGKMIELVHELNAALDRERGERHPSRKD